MSAPVLAAVLRAAGWTVELHKENFPERPDIPDHEWIPIIAARGYSIISSDKSMKGWRAEGGLVRPAIERSHAKVFFLRGEGLQLPDQAHAVGVARVALCRCVKKHAGTYLIARIHSVGTRLGEVMILHPLEGTPTEKKYGYAGAAQRPESRLVADHLDRRDEPA